MAVMYSARPQSFACDGESVCVALAFPGRSLITGLVIRQTGGAAVAFTVAMFNTENACGGLSESDSVDEAGPGDAGPLHPDLYRICDDIASDDPGSLTYFAEQRGGMGFLLHNQDGRDGRGRDTRTRVPDRVWLRLTPATPGAYQFAVSLHGLPADM